MSRTGLGLAVFCLAAAAGTLTDAPRRSAPPSMRVLAGDFHVHAAPGDGMLPVWEIQREASRRGLDVIAITNHNHDLASRIAEWLGLVASYPIVIPSQELTTPAFHMAAVGVTKMIDWRLPLREAIEAIHEQGGVAIASHPMEESWEDPDVEALGKLDGAEAAHPSMLARAKWQRELAAFFERARKSNRDLSPIGSSDSHGGPIGVCRTYLIVDEVSREGVLDAIRRGRTVASCPGGRLIGADDHIALVRQHKMAPPAAGFGYGRSTWIALAALLALSVAVNRTRRAPFA